MNLNCVFAVLVKVVPSKRLRFDGGVNPIVDFYDFAFMVALT